VLGYTPNPFDYPAAEAASTGGQGIALADKAAVNLHLFTRRPFRFPALLFNATILPQKNLLLSG
jgi:hypothetical protein